jgi:hypothetical protein
MNDEERRLKHHLSRFCRDMELGPLSAGRRQVPKSGSVRR